MLCWAGPETLIVKSPVMEDEIHCWFDGFFQFSADEVVASFSFLLMKLLVVDVELSWRLLTTEKPSEKDKIRWISFDKIDHYNCSWRLCDKLDRNP